MIDVTRETLMTIKEATRHPFFRSGEKPGHCSKVYRAIDPGCRGISGKKRHRLDVVQTTAGMRTSQEAISRLEAAMNDRTAPASQSGKQRQLLAADQLRGAGLID